MLNNENDNNDPRMALIEAITPYLKENYLSHLDNMASFIKMFDLFNEFQSNRKNKMRNRFSHQQNSTQKDPLKLLECVTPFLKQEYREKIDSFSQIIPMLNMFSSSDMLKNLNLDSLFKNN